MSSPVFIMQMTPLLCTSMHSQEHMCRGVETGLCFLLQESIVVCRVYGRISLPTFRARVRCSSASSVCRAAASCCRRATLSACSSPSASPAVHLLPACSMIHDS